MVNASIGALFDLVAWNTNIGQLIVIELFKLSGGVGKGLAAELFNFRFCVVCKQAKKETLLNVCCVCVCHVALLLVTSSCVDEPDKSSRH